MATASFCISIEAVLCLAGLVAGSALPGPSDHLQDLEIPAPPSFPLQEESLGEDGNPETSGPTESDFEGEILQLFQELGSNPDQHPVTSIEEKYRAQEEGDIQRSSSTQAVCHADLIALQAVHFKRKWIGCTGNPCSSAMCPGIYMEGQNWFNCWGEVFQIYRLYGTGDVHVGDVVGIYYPHESGQWFGCGDGICGRSTCPGTPNVNTGFSDSDDWYNCWGEVFKVYARGKQLGATIVSHDHLMLFHVFSQEWVGLITDKPDLRTCPGLVRPPLPGKYDQCWGEVFEIWKKPSTYSM